MSYGLENKFKLVCDVIYMIERKIKYRVRYRGRNRLKFKKV